MSDAKDLGLPHPLAPGEMFIKCPFNPSHIILKKRELTHIIKCRKAYVEDRTRKGLEIDIEPCRFNFSHQLSRVEMMAHEASCPDRYETAKFIHHRTSEEGLRLCQEVRARGETSRTQLDNAVRYDYQDSWDSDKPAKTYDPARHLETGKFFYMPSLMTKSKKKAFREENRKKFLRMTNEDDVDSSSEESDADTDKDEMK